MHDIVNMPNMDRVQALIAAVHELEARKISVQERIQTYYHRLNRQLGPLINATAQLHQQWLIQRASQTRRRSDREAAVSANTRFEQTRRTLQDALHDQSTSQHTDDEAVELRQLYRHAAAQAHPDRFFDNASRQQQATAFMIRLNDAYARKDLSTLRQLVQQLEDGLVFLDEKMLHENHHALLKITDKLTNRKHILEAEIQALQQQEAYRIMTLPEEAQHAHFDQLQKNMEEHMCMLVQMLDQT